MSPLDTADNLDIDISQIGFEGADATPTFLWLRVAGTPVTFGKTRGTGEPRTYDVVYEYAGRQYRTQMPQDPGRFVRLNVTPADALPPLPPPVVYPSYQPQTQYVEPSTRITIGTTYYPSYPGNRWGPGYPYPRHDGYHDRRGNDRWERNR